MRPGILHMPNKCFVPLIMILNRVHSHPKISFYFGLTMRLARSQFPRLGLNPGPSAGSPDF